MDKLQFAHPAVKNQHLTDLPHWWLAHGIPIFIGSMWIGLIVEAIASAA